MAEYTISNIQLPNGDICNIKDTVTTVTTTGSGNAITAISANNGALTVTKGTTFLTSHQDISGKKNIQSAINDPSANGTTISFIDSITQNTQGVISPTKKTIPDATITTAGLMNATDKTKLDNAHPYITSEFSSIVSINDALNENAASVIVNIEPSQDLHGYDYPWPAGGGKNKLYRIDSILPRTENGITITADGSDSVKVTGTASATIGFNIFEVPIETGKTYTLSLGTTLITGVYFNLPKYNGNTNIGNLANGLHVNNSSTTFTADGTFNRLVCRLTIDKNVNPNGIIVKLQAEEGSTASAYTPYSNICPISGWTGARVSHSGEDTSDPEVEVVSWQSEAGTIYGGTLDLTEGTLTVTNAIVDCGSLTWYKNEPHSQFFAYAPQSIVSGYNGETVKCSHYKSGDSYNRTVDKSVCGRGSLFWIFDSDYTSQADFRSAMNGVQLVYELANPVVYQLTPTQITLLANKNNLWANCGKIQVGYLRDDSLSINQAIKTQLNNITVTLEDIGLEIATVEEAINYLNINISANGLYF